MSGFLLGAAAATAIVYLGVAITLRNKKHTITAAVHMLILCVVLLLSGVFLNRTPANTSAPQHQPTP